LPSEKWHNSELAREQWTDIVIDLSEYKNKIIDNFDICLNMLGTLNPVGYIDNIEFNSNSQKRQPAYSFLDEIACTLKINDPDWNFTDTYPTVDITLKNSTSQSQTFQLICDVYTDKMEAFDKQQKEMTLQTGESKTETFTLNTAIPNFYRYYINLSEGSNIRQKTYKVIGYKPEEIVSPNDAQADFDTFWDTAIEQLKTTPPNFKVTESSKSGGRILYNVEMTSIDGYLLKGYYSVPDKEGQFPVIIRSLGFSVTASVPSRADDYIEFSYNIRGQGISNTNPFSDDWLIAGLPNKETYYYRGAYMDALRAVDFVCSRPEVDLELVFAEGESQGGALTLAIASLDNRIKGAVALEPFLSDFEDYYTIKENVKELPLWPMNVFDSYMISQSVTHEQLFSTLTYFDIKNLAGKVECPVLMAVGLQDETCPPHTNFAAYNQVNTDKEYHICKECGHWMENAFHVYKIQWYNDLIRKIKEETKILTVDKSKMQIKSSGSSILIESQSISMNPLQLNIYTLDGIALFSGKVNLPYKSKLLHDGVYIVKVGSTGESFVEKIIVKN
jgi:cephalosporin-C deacetylase-like acetyl esterase